MSGNQEGQSTLVTCVFNLVASMVGGGVLSLPYALAKAGLAGGLGITVVGGLASGLSMHLLMCCARRTHSATYFAIARSAFGWWGGLATTITIFVEMLLVPVGYLVLLRDIIASMLELGLQQELAREQQKWIIVAVAAVLLPLFLRRSLHELRHTCVVGFFGVLMLGGCLLVKAVEINASHPKLFSEHVRLGPSRSTSLLEVLPIITLAFTCQVNGVSIHNNLQDPTHARCKQVVMLACCSAGVMYILVAIAGYLCAYEDTQGDIFLNFSAKDRVMLLGKLVLGATLLAALPVNFLPIRDSAFGLWKLLRRRPQGPQTTHHQQEKPLRPKAGGPNGYQSINGSGANSDRQTPEEVDSENPWHLPEIPVPLEHHDCTKTGLHGDSAPELTVVEQVAHVLVTLVILGVILCIALVVPGVATVWEWCGSTVAMFIAFVLPAAFYLKLSSGETGNIKRKWSAVLLVAGLAAALLCTWVTVTI